MTDGSEVPMATAATSEDFDPILVEIMRHELAAINEEMASAIMRTGRSQLVKMGDFATSFCDRAGDLIGVAAGSPLQLPALMEVARRAARWPGLGPGDVLVTNDPYAGMGHLPDVAIAAPCFVEGDLVGFALTYSHHSDIGGRFAGGSSSQSEEVYEEGIRIPLTVLYRGGELNQTLVDLVLANVRSADEWLGDLDAKVVGCRRGIAQLGEMVERHGVAAFQDLCEYLFRFAESTLHEAILQTPDGSYEHRSVFHEGSGGAAVDVVLTAVVTVDGGSLTVDLSGCSPQVRRAINLPLGATQGAVLSALRYLSSEDIAINAGFFRAVDLVIPPGTVVNPVRPAPVGGRAPMIFAVYEVVLRALAQAVPAMVGVPGEGGDLLHVSGTDDDGTEFTGTDIFFGGWGGRPSQDGIDGVAPLHFGAFATAPAELVERSLPVAIDFFGLIPDTAGPGRFRGSLAVLRVWRFTETATVMIRTNNLRAPDGIAGGGPGSRAGTMLLRHGEDVPLAAHSHVHFEAQPGDRLLHWIGGSGGYGPASDRPPESVRTDVIEGRLSPSVALELYGVAFTPLGQVDTALTAARRAESHNGSPVARDVTLEALDSLLAGVSRPRRERRPVMPSAGGVPAAFRHQPTT